MNSKDEIFDEMFEETYQIADESFEGFCHCMLYYKRK